MINQPNINVTPLIDVLLVLLIIFMVVSPLKPTDFKTKIPQKTEQSGEPNPRTLVVSVDLDLSLRLNTENNLGTAETPEKLVERLSAIFRERLENRSFAEDKEFKAELPESERVEKTVFIKAPRAIGYGSFVKVLDAVKLAGASPISLQIDDLER